MAEIEQAILEDGIDAVGNMVAAENHALEVARTTNLTEMYVVADELRQSRQITQAKIFGENKDDPNKKRSGSSEKWCAEKHILLARVCLKEVAQKEISRGDFKKAAEYLDLANELFGILQVMR